MSKSTPPFLGVGFICLVVFQSHSSLGGPCKVKPFQQNLEEYNDFSDAMYFSSEVEDYHTELDIIPKANYTKLNLSADYSDVEEGPFLEGDIIPSSSNVRYSELGVKWPNATVPFLFHNMMSLEGRIQVLRAMNEYHRHTCIQFKKRQVEQDYLVIGSSYHYICASNVGRQGGAQLLHLGPTCTRALGTPMHELMHALGFVHEHMRPDRDRYIYINYSNIDHVLWKNFHEIHPSLILTELGAGYDFSSLMHYRLCAMTNNSWPTIVPKVDPQTDVIGQRKGFSRKDIIKLNNFYNCSAISRYPKLFAVGLEDSDRKSPKSGSHQKNINIRGLNLKLICFIFNIGLIISYNSVNMGLLN